MKREFRINPADCVPFRTRQVGAVRAERHQQDETHSAREVLVGSCPRHSPDTSNAAIIGATCRKST